MPFKFNPLVGKLDLVNSTPSSLGTVTSVSVTSANGVSGSVATATTTPAITLTLGAITPTTVNGLTITANGTNTLNITAGKTLTVQDNVTISGALGTGAYVTIANYATLATPVFTSSITMGVAGGATGSAIFKGVTSGTVTLKVADEAGTWTMTLPTNDGDAGQALISNGSGVCSWGAAGLTWTAVTDDTSMAVDNGYLANKASLCVLTLPATAAVGKTVRVAGMNANLWKIAQNANGIIHFGNKNSTTGVGGYIQATGTYDAVELVCVVANNEWVVASAQGNITIA